MDKLKPMLAKKFSKPPSDDDLAWAYLNKKTLDYVKHRQWGLYRNTWLSMAAVLEQKGELDDALRLYLEVCYLDLNGPQNRGDMPLSGMRDFMVNVAFLAPAVVAKVLEMIFALKLDEHQVGSNFMQIAEHNNHNLKLPLSPTETWRKLSAELYV